MRLFRRREPRAVRLYYLLAAGSNAAWAALNRAEERLAAASPEERTAYAVDVLETLQNLLSHPDSPVAPAAVRERLGPVLGRMWDELDAHWLVVADWVDATGPASTKLTPEQVLNVSDRELARLARGLHRTMPDGRFVGVTDVARRAIATGEAFAVS
jgi:hypothetical protein